MIALTQEKREELVSRLKIYIRTTETAIKADLATEEDLFNLEVRKIALASLTAGPVVFIHPNMLDSMTDEDPRTCGRVYVSSVDELSNEVRVALFTVRPVPEIKLPEQRHEYGNWESVDINERENSEGWNDCLAEIKRLNGLEE